MNKRPVENNGQDDGPLKAGERPQKITFDEVGDFEDEYEDEFESEDEIIEAGVDGRPDADREMEEKDEAMDYEHQTFIVGRSKLEPGQTLSPDLSTYEMLHSLRSPWPCLSFDIIKDNMGDNRMIYPATIYAVAGTQAARKRENENQLLVMKFSGLSRMDQGQNEDEDADDNDDDAEYSDPILESCAIPLNSTTNRIRVHQIPALDSSRPPTTLTASMTEAGQVLIHDVTPQLNSFDFPGSVLNSQQNKPLSTIRIHKTEGYAIDWSPLLSTCKLVTGDNDGMIFLTTRTSGEGWVTDTRPFTGHTGSVEELQWSPSEHSVFASASSDGTIKIWDVRSKSRKSALSVSVSDTDVNVMSWSHQTSHLLASGADDGAWAIWDLRQWKPTAASNTSLKSTPVASFNYHKEQVTSIEWNPADDSILAVASADDTITLWDLAVELDDEESKNTGGVTDVPPQLLFVHYMEKVKELHFHPQIPGSIVATGETFNIFKTISV